MHVRTVEFLGLARNGQERRIGELRTPEESVALTEHLGAIRIGFDIPFAPTGPRSPTTAGVNDPDFQTHNVQLRLSREVTEMTGLRYLAGKLVVEDSRTLRIDVARGTRLVNRNGGWLANRAIGCEIFLRGTAGAADNQPELADGSGNGLDGEPRPPFGGVMSGDGTAGGDFIASFTVFING